VTIFAAEWTPIVLTPLVFVGWLLLFAGLWRSSTGSKPPLITVMPGGKKLRTYWWRLKFRLDRPAERRRTLVWARRRDAEENAETTPPADERVTWVASWICEIYGPSQVDALRDGLRRLGWDADASETRDILRWLDEARDHSGGWTSAGAFRPRSSTTFPTTRRMDMPDDFALVLPYFVQVAPGLTVLVTGWLLSRDARDTLDVSRRLPWSRSFVAAVTGYSAPRMRKPPG
jgi:hypothetical protein